MKIHLKYLLLAVSVCLTLAACGDDDDYHYPSVELSFLTGITDGNGALCRVLADDGSTHTVAEDRTNRITTPDTVIRILANYERIETESAEGSHAKIYSWSNIVSPLPQLPAYFKDDIKTHPVNVVSIFKGYRYLNLIVTVREQTAKHRFHFVEGDSWTDEAGGNMSVSPCITTPTDLCRIMTSVSTSRCP